MASHPERMLRQIEHKPGKKAVFIKHNMPKKRKTGFVTSVCIRCGRKGWGHTGKYGLQYCRICFREIAKELGFEKYM